MASFKDKDELVINPITGKLDVVRNFNANRIVTAEYNQAGSLRMVYDIASASYIEEGYVVVTDDEGNVITT